MSDWCPTVAYVKTAVQTVGRIDNLNYVCLYRTFNVNIIIENQFCPAKLTLTFCVNLALTSFSPKPKSRRNW